MPGIGLLGPLEIDGAPAHLAPRDRVVLTALAARRGAVVSADGLAEALWGESPPASWPKVVQGCVLRLRRTLGADAVERVGSGYRLVRANDLDAAAFEELVRRGRALAETGEAARAASTFARGLALWRGSPLQDVDSWLPARNEAGRLEELKRSVEEELLEARLVLGEHRDVAAEAEVCTAEEPLRERRWAILAVAQYRCGRQGDALRSLNRARLTLSEQLGIDPSRELVALESAILRQDAQLLATTEFRLASDVCPYKGLAPYDVDDAEGFFGRDTDIAECLDKLASTSFVVIVGPSGSGKSSLARAGIAPVLKGRGNDVVIFTPGVEPDDAMTGALASARGTPVLVVDQLEEAVTLAQPEQLASFCQRLAAYAAEQAPVVATVRADHLAAVSADAAFARLVERGLHLVNPLSGEDLREVIERPAAQAGLRLEHGLTDLLVRDAEGEPGALPLLSHALAETWQRRDGRVLTVDGYRETGGIRGAVARSAERLYETLALTERPLLRSVLLRLVAPTPDGEPVRSRVQSRSLTADPARERVVNLLIRARLVTTTEDTVELAHEALARAWPRLRSWLDDDAAGQRILRHLARAAEDWEALGRPASELYRGARLDTAVEWRDATRPDLTEVEAAYLDASAAQATSEQVTLHTRARFQARQNRRLRVLLSAAALFLVLSLVAGLLAVDAGGDARTQRQDARLQALASQSLALRATSRDVAALLAVEAHRRGAGVDAWSALLGTFTASQGFLGRRYLPADSSLNGALVPGTTTAVVALDQRALRLLDLQSGELDDRFPPVDDNGDRDSLLSVSDDGHFVAHYVDTRFDAGRPCRHLAHLPNTDDRGCAALSVYDVASGERVLGPITPPFGLGDVAINADGSLVAVAGGWDGGVAVYRIPDGELVGTLAGLPRPPDVLDEVLRDTAAVAFAPDGRLFVGALQGTVRAVDPETLDVLDTFDAPPRSTSNHLVSTSDALIGVGDHYLVAIDPASGELRWASELHDFAWVEPCPFLAVASATERLYCGNNNGQIEERDLVTGQRTGLRIDAQLGGVGTLALSPDGRELVAFSYNRPTVSRWRLDGTGLVSRRVADGYVALDYNPAGDRLLVSSAALIDTGFDDVAVWDARRDRLVDPVVPTLLGALWLDDDVIGGQFGLDGPIGSYDLDAQARTGSVLPTTLTFVGAWLAVDASQVYVALTDGSTNEHGNAASVVVWTIDTSTGERVEPSLQVDGWVHSLAATADGRRIFVTVDRFPAGNSVLSFDGRSGELLRERGTDDLFVAVSSNDVLVAGNLTGTITQYDLDTLQPIATFPSSVGVSHTLRFSADGTVLSVTSSDQTVSILDVESRQRIGDPIPATGRGLNDGGLRSDGRELAVNLADGIVIWDIDPDHLATAACRLAGRNLTRTEWDTYLRELGEYRVTCPEFDVGPT